MDLSIFTLRFLGVKYGLKLRSMKLYKRVAYFSSQKAFFGDASKDKKLLRHTVPLFKDTQLWTLPAPSITPSRAIKKYIQNSKLLGVLKSDQTSKTSQLLIGRQVWFNIKLFVKKISALTKQEFGHFYRDHSFSTFANLFEKLIILTSWFANVDTRIRGQEMLVFRKILRTY